MTYFYSVAISKYPLDPLIYQSDEVLECGTRVYVPLRNSKRMGYVVEEVKPPAFKTREVFERIDKSPVLTPEMVRLAKEMARLYIVSVGEIFDLFFLPPHQNPKKKGREFKLRYVTISAPISQILNSKLGKREEELVELLMEKEAVEYSEVLKKFSSSTIRALERKGYVEIIRSEEPRLLPSRPVSLTEDQEKIVNEVITVPKRPHLIYGVTGSGKTEVYFEIAEKILQQSKKVLVLVPEISLTPQLLMRTKKRFASRRIGIYHSALGAARRREWLRATNGESDIIIGTRSAVWLPIKNLGLIIVDEEQDESFKQYAMRPYYNAVDVAKRRCELENAILLLSSATPRVETYQAAKEGEIVLHELKARPVGSMPRIEIVDMRARNGEIVSNELVKKIESVAKEGNQSFLFVPRKGFSTRIQCAQCGHIFMCPHCDVALSFHRSKGVAKCHYCGYTQPLPQRCPECGSFNITLGGIGTEKVENEVSKIFPGLRVKRIDREEINDISELEKALKEISKMNIDVVVGTKMITKGLDFPRVALVGVIDVDRVFGIPDFRATERAFQLVAQMAGRAGRGVKGEVLIQTREPENPVFEAIQKGNFDEFYERELKRRKELGYPPYKELILLTVENKSVAIAKSFMQKMVEILRKGPFELLGPVEAMIFKMNSLYRYQLLLKCESLDDAVDFLKKKVTKEELGFEPREFVKIDVQPYSV